MGVLYILAQLFARLIDPTIGLLRRFELLLDILEIILVTLLGNLLAQTTIKVLLRAGLLFYSGCIE